MAIKIDKSEIEKKYYYEENGNTFGPFPLSQLLSKIDHNTLVYSEDSEWKEAKDVTELAKYFKVFNNTSGNESDLSVTSENNQSDQVGSGKSVITWVLLGLLILIALIFIFNSQRNSKSADLELKDSLTVASPQLSEFEIFNLDAIRSFHPTEEQRNLGLSLINEGNTAFANQDYLRSIDSYKNSIKNFPQASTFFQLAESYLATRDYDRSYECLQLANSLDYQPKSEIDYKLVVLSALKGENENAKNEILNLVRSDPNILSKIETDSNLLSFRTSISYLDIIESNVAIDSVREESEYLNSILNYYDALNSKDVDAHDFFSENVIQYINKRNTNPDVINQIIHANADFINPKATVIGSRVFVSGSNARQAWLSFTTYRNSKKINQSCRVKVEFVFDEVGKIVSYRELAVKDLIFK